MWSRNCLPFRSTRVHTLVFSGVRVARSLVFCVVFCTSLFVIFLLGIVLSVLLQCTASDYPFGILWTLHCLFFFDVQLLITPLVSCGHCILWPSSMYSFWLPLWYLVAIVLSVLRCTASDYPFGILLPLCFLSFDVQLLITPLGILWPLCFLSFDAQLLITPLGILWPLCCLSFFDVQLLITPLASSNFSYWFIEKQDTMYWNIWNEKHFYCRLFAKTNVFGNPITNLKVFATRT
jgi:hypothetical protein